MFASYYFKTALKNIKFEKWINLLSMLTVSVSLLIIAVTFTFLYNVEMIAAKLPERFSIVAYFVKDISNADMQTFYDNLIKNPAVAKAKIISKEDAMNELKKTLNDKSILEGLDENPLSASVEIKLKQEYVNSKDIKKFATDLKKNSIIDEIVYAEKTAETIYSLKKTIENMTLIIMTIIIAGIIFVIYSTVKILFYRKRDEIEIMKLIGATASFIKNPFLIEGGIIGLSAGIFALTIFFWIYFMLTYRLNLIFPFLKSIVLPMQMFIALPFAGMLFGVIGSAIAIGRIKP